MSRLEYSYILNPATNNVIIVEVLLDLHGKQTDLRRTVRKLSELPTNLREKIVTPSYKSHFEYSEVPDDYKIKKVGFFYLLAFCFFIS